MHLHRDFFAAQDWQDIKVFVFQMMLETIGLVETLEWNVMGKLALGIEDYDRPGELSVAVTLKKSNMSGASKTESILIDNPWHSS